MDQDTERGLWMVALAAGMGLASMVGMGFFAGEVVETQYWWQAVLLGVVMWFGMSFFFGLVLIFGAIVWQVGHEMYWAERQRGGTRRDALKRGALASGLVLGLFILMGWCSGGAPPGYF